MMIFSITSKFSIQSPLQIALKDERHLVGTASIPTNNGKYTQVGYINKQYTSQQELSDDYSFFDGNLSHIQDYFGVANETLPDGTKTQFLQLKIHPGSSALYDNESVQKY
jgi:hypothetical protein